MCCMNSYETEQYNAIQNWKSEEPSVLSQAFGTIAKPITWLTEKIIPQRAIEAALKGLGNCARFLADSDDIKRDANICSISELKTRELRLCDNLANEVHNWAIATAAAEGGVTGALGIAGMMIDIPSIVTMGLRVIYKIGLCYGYEFNDCDDKSIILEIMSVASANTMKEKNASLLVLKQMNNLIAKTAWKRMAQTGALGATIITIKNLAKQIGINITKRKALQAIPAIGAGVGASMNANYINDIAWAARRTFQERWLIDNGKISVDAESEEE